MRVHVAFTGIHTPLVSHVCCACRKGIPTGVISYGSRVHEPHCDACCKDWEAAMRLHEFSIRLSLADFRAWQAERAGQA